MAGAKCPNCTKKTFHKTHGENRECSNCGYKMNVPPNAGKGGRGKQCVRCKKYTLFNDKCSNPECGATYTLPKKRK